MWKEKERLLLSIAQHRLLSTCRAFRLFGAHDARKKNTSSNVSCRCLALSVLVFSTRICAHVSPTNDVSKNVVFV